MPITFAKKLKFILSWAGVYDTMDIRKRADGGNRQRGNEEDNPVTTGEKIKRIRQHRKMTQKELGEAIGLGAAGANRIAQYEMGYRVPKRPLLQKMAEAMHVSPMALAEGSNGAAADMLEQLFWLDEEIPGVICLVQTQRSAVPYNVNPGLALHYDDNDDWPPASPVAMWFNSTVLDEFLRDWAKVQQQLWHREITEAEYFEWKICWPGHD